MEGNLGNISQMLLGHDGTGFRPAWKPQVRGAGGEEMGVEGNLGNIAQMLLGHDGTGFRPAWKPQVREGKGKGREGRER